ncbi:hypothetical protein POVCU2_0021460, partial [Plasmodium ovale curtisi]
FSFVSSNVHKCKLKIGRRGSFHPFRAFDLQITRERQFVFYFFETSETFLQPKSPDRSGSSLSKRVVYKLELEEKDKTLKEQFLCQRLGPRLGPRLGL